MYNPHSLHQCEIEKKRNPRKWADRLMTGVGLIASVSSIPQVLKLWETQDPTGISLATQLIALGTVIAWFFYGLYIKNKPLFITSLVSSFVLGTVVVQIFMYR